MSERAWDRYVHHVHTWGTVIVLDVRAAAMDEARVVRACEAAAAELERINAVFSTYRADSAVSQIRTGVLTVQEAPADVQAVVAACTRLRKATDGAFDPWAAVGGFDPSGYVKGWGADRAAAIVLEHGYANVSVNAAGDVTCRGEARAGQGGWQLGIADPRDPQQVLTSVRVTDAHLATSGRYEQGDHIVDPSTGAPARSVLSASVLAAEGGDADALTKLLMVRGPAGLAALPAGADALLVTPERVWSRGSTFAEARP